MGVRAALLVVLLALAIGHFTTAAEPEKVNFKEEVAPVLLKYCVGCHGGDDPKGDLALDGFKDEAAALKAARTWREVRTRLHEREMPPEGKPQPSEAEREQVIRWIDAALLQLASQTKNPGRVTIRRLNRAEYNNTIRDLVGVHFQPADEFPSDDVGYGFDNIGDVLTLSPLLMEKYLAAADKIVEKAFQWKEPRAHIMICEIRGNRRERMECARKIIENFARRAYRRPVTEEEVKRLLRFVEKAEQNKDSTETGLKQAIKAILVSPHFLFRVELDRPSFQRLSQREEGEKVSPGQRLSDYELASRLSYFLWSSMPDEELFKLAGNKTLHKPEVLEKQVRRMLQDEKARGLAENFAGQWLQFRNLKAAMPDPKLFPKWDARLRDAMMKESELFFEAIIKEDRSILDLLDADFTFVNERLAKHYGIDGVKGDDFQRVKLTGNQRGGVLTMASVLTVTSNPTRTSPVKRGMWILENILNTPPPPPPPGAGELSEDQKIVESAPLRQRLEQHRTNPSCASCHQRMDPLGFALENYDAIGSWRTRDGKFPIDPSGALPNGQTFNGPQELKAILKDRKDEFSRCLIEKLLTYALGRGLEDYDKPVIEKIATTLAQDRYRFSVLVLEIVRSEPFQMKAPARSVPQQGPGAGTRRKGNK